MGHRPSATTMGRSVGSRSPPSSAAALLFSSARRRRRTAIRRKSRTACRRGSFQSVLLLQATSRTSRRRLRRCARRPHRPRCCPHPDACHRRISVTSWVTSCVSPRGRDSDNESSDSQVQTVEGASDASESDHELDYQDLYDEDQLEYEAALDSDAYCSDGSW